MEVGIMRVASKKNISSSISILMYLLKLRDDGCRVLAYYVILNNFEQHVNNSVYKCANHQTLIKIFSGKKVFDLLFDLVSNRALTSFDGSAAFTTV